MPPPPGTNRVKDLLKWTDKSTYSPKTIFDEVAD